MGIAANLKTTKATTEKIIKVYFEAFSENFQVLNFKAINFTGAFNKKQLTSVSAIKKNGFKIIAL